MRVDDTLYLPSPPLPTIRSGDGTGTALSTPSARTALTRSGRSRGVLPAAEAGAPLQGEVLARTRVTDRGVESYLALGRVAPAAAVPRSLYVDLYA
jgi:hypothetical protein